MSEEKKRKCIRIEMEFDDGTIETAEDADAQKILENFAAGIALALIHGIVYEWPKSKVVKK